MRNQLSWLAGFSGALVLLSAGCDRAGVVRAPTRVIPEEPESPAVVTARAASEDHDAAPAKDKTAPAEPEFFRFPDDPGGELLRKQLTPSATRPLPEPPAQPRRAPTLVHLEAPELPLPPSLAGFAALPPERPRQPIRPRLVTPEVLLGAAFEGALPAPQPMPVGPRTRLDGIDVNKPAPLPTQSQPVPDRASLADATTDASGAAVLSAAVPIRQRPVPFQRLSVPDPFEFRRPLSLPLPPESTDPVAGPPRTPK